MSEHNSQAGGLPARVVRNESVPLITRKSQGSTNGTHPSRLIPIKDLNSDPHTGTQSSKMHIVDQNVSLPQLSGVQEGQN